MINENIVEIVYLKSNQSNTCKICDFVTDNFELAMNHMMSKHGYCLKFIGTETDTGPKDMPFHYTIAILGK